MVVDSPRTYHEVMKLFFNKQGDICVKISEIVCQIVLEHVTLWDGHDSQVLH